LSINKAIWDKAADALARHDAIQWEVGDLLLKDAPRGVKDGTLVQKMEEGAKYLEEVHGISRSVEVLTDWRDTAEAYLSDRRRSNRSWTVHYTLRTQDDRVKLLPDITSARMAQEFVSARQFKSNVSVPEYEKFVEAKKQDKDLTLRAYFTSRRPAAHTPVHAAREALMVLKKFRMANPNGYADMQDTPHDAELLSELRDLCLSEQKALDPFILPLSHKRSA
jgi:hypothetical protein